MANLKLLLEQYKQKSNDYDIMRESLAVVNENLGVAICVANGNDRASGGVAVIGDHVVQVTPNPDWEPGELGEGPYDIEWRLLPDAARVR